MRGTEGGEDAAPPRPACYTPQQVRFTDGRGTLWTVRCAHRLPALGAEPPAVVAVPAAGLPIVDDRRIDDEGFRIAACRAGHCWLEFAAVGARRRLRLVPPRWYALPPASLALLCEEAETLES